MSALINEMCQEIEKTGKVVVEAYTGQVETFVSWRCKYGSGVQFTTSDDCFITLDGTELHNEYKIIR